MYRRVFFTSMYNPLAVASLTHGQPLSMHTQQIFMQVAAKRPPDRIVVTYPLGTLLWRVALQSQSTEFDNQFVRPQWNRRIHSQYRCTKVEGHSREKIDQHPTAGSQAWPAHSAFLATCIRVVFDRHRTHRCMAVRIPLVLAIKVAWLHHPRNTVEVKQKNKKKHAKQNKPQFVIRIDDRLMIGKD